MPAGRRPQVQSPQVPTPSRNRAQPAVGISLYEAIAMGRPVRLVLDASLLLLESPATGEAAAAVALRPGAEALLRRLHYSNLSVNYNWRVVSVGYECGDVSYYILERFVLVRVDGNRYSSLVQETGGSSVLVIGYVMKQSREEDFARRGAFPIDPSKDGLIFVPLSFELPLSLQLQEVDMVLHKITDEIVKIDPNCSNDFPKGISFSAGMSEIIRFVEEHPDFCIIDPFKNIYPLLDRLQIQKILVQLQEHVTGGKPKLRAPYSLKVDDFHDGELDKHLAEANLSFPLIVKPQVACGVSDAHNMALVFQIEEFRNLGVPLPGVLQEYVDHGSKILKFYVIGDKVFHAVRNSMPNASFLKSSSGGEPLTFNRYPLNTTHWLIALLSVDC
ncbi:Inositol-tetrakisphosphate 1-kinase 6 [Dichanthelium oligosanthes]|uniref:inositol-1,3,4-trisphosphate 5/6-kinase n=1 Tax=Dichanthelium oligosanthes TaxID=888268 RepID=A0A1E5VAJ6_9POAL|nr:Inositol-tetrakisphosphate 1-kinase 6 [Dichanthelium oligosanthes]